MKWCSFRFKKEPESERRHGSEKAGAGSCTLWQVLTCSVAVEIFGSHNPALQGSSIRPDPNHLLVHWAGLCSATETRSSRTQKKGRSFGEFCFLRLVPLVSGRTLAPRRRTDSTSSPQKEAAANLFQPQLLIWCRCDADQTCDRVM